MKNSYRNLVLEQLAKIRTGSLTVVFPDSNIRKFGSEASRLRADLIVHRESFFKSLVLQGDIGFGQSYVAGDWDSHDLRAFIELLLANKATLLKKTSPAIRLLKSFILGVERVQHWLNRNTIKQSHRNIYKHYDLGNAFYEAFLDSTMTYSSAWFTQKDQTLDDAQEEKYDRICRKLNLSQGMHLLEVGCGWGGFAVYAAQNYNCKVTGVTISQRQYDYAVNRAKADGLSSNVNFLLQDYRRLKGKYDRVVSIEMIEAVGHRFLPQYFSVLERLLKKDGLIAIQAILCPDSSYEFYRKRVDWLRKYIFPGGHLPSIKAIFDALESYGSELNLFHFESFGVHYAQTLSTWKHTFNRNWERIKAMGFDEAFRRKWNMYLVLCEAGFAQRHINVGQFVYGRANQQSYGFEDFEQPDSMNSRRTNLKLANFS
jgi:cyclopropane-fatty-acyl-phospholipid synthase